MEDQVTDEPKPEQDPVLEEEQQHVSEEAKEEKQHVTVESSDDVVSSSKKTKQSTLRTKQVTVPQPFSLATEKRMGRERKGSVELSSSSAAKPKLTKSASLSYRTRSSSEKAGEISTSSKVKGTTAATKTEINPGIKERKEVEIKKSQVTNKIEAEKESKKLVKSSTFKASPLPSFYSRKGPLPKPELKKASGTQPKAPSLGQTQRSKAVTSTVKNKVEEKVKVSSKNINGNTKEKIGTLIARAPKTFDVTKQTVEPIVSSA